jgi:hypothetical protein
VSALRRHLYFNDAYRDWRPWIGLSLVLIILHLLRLLLALGGELHPDEAYYWAWSQKPALSYYDQGPGISYYIWLWVSAFGSSYLTLKCAALFAGALSLFFFTMAGRTLGMHGWQPLILLLTLFFIPGIVGGNALIMHDSMMILNWSGALWMALRCIRFRGAGDLIGLFFFLGMGGLSKYTMFLFAIALVLWLVLHPDYREFWLRPASWLGLFLALALISPIIVWNMQNNWDGIGAIIHLRSSGGTSGEASTGSYIIGQFIMFSPLWMLTFIGLATLRAIHWFRSRKGGKTLESSGSVPALADETRWQWAAIHLLWIVTGVVFLFLFVLIWQARDPGELGISRLRQRRYIAHLLSFTGFGILPCRARVYRGRPTIPCFEVGPGPLHWWLAAGPFSGCLLSLLGTTGIGHLYGNLLDPRLPNRGLRRNHLKN